eukprot:CAMPEP_0118714204 /NCGR_PEP_ID=MMETSP0800-20121206/26035_1 /TAXON_ID=210618 ORGANISM="Striatella unipunctata, Strain CCMP2910" /NCGR_SAMPLE_ID=MMETSP0800 /ASSEMBLY_ACC=CAM_ASM_000638 /LENGTH=271 /DNA_ID=CAMNT_0006619927 /DNA_START=122 /DNA_END=933 /DNA_ORIENTATION=-
MTGAPIMECKKALKEVGEDNLDKAVDWLRQHGAAKATKKVTGRAATEGLVGLRVDPSGKRAAMVLVHSETDFASRSEAFGSLVHTLLSATMTQPSVNALPSMPLQDDDAEMNQRVADLMEVSDVKTAMETAILAIRENLSVAQAIHMETEGQLFGYIHGKVYENAGTAAALVDLHPESSEAATEIGKKLAMHVVAAKPLYATPEMVPSEELEREKSVLISQMSDSGKPLNVVEKIVQGRLRKFYEGACLTEQPHMVEEGNPKVSKVLQEAG